MSYLDAGPRRPAGPGAAAPGLSLPRGGRAELRASSPRRPDDQNETGGRVSRYARGRDYHDVIRPRLVELGEFIRTAAGAAVTSRAAVDSSAVLERDLAARAGLGWIGKNTNLLTPVARLLLLHRHRPHDRRARRRRALPDRCGTCTACLDACPTRAFVAPYVLDARRCISYLTIEHRGDIAGELAEQIGRMGLRLRRVPGGVPVEPQGRARRASPRSARPERSDRSRACSSSTRTRSARGSVAPRISQDEARRPPAECRHRPRQPRRAERRARASRGRSTTRTPWCATPRRGP